MTERDQAMQSVSSEAFESIRSERDALRGRVKKLEDEEADLRRWVEYGGKRVFELRDRIKELERMAAADRATISCRDRQLEEAMSRNRELERQNADLNAQVVKAVGRIGELRVENAKLKAELASAGERAKIRSDENHKLRIGLTEERIKVAELERDALCLAKNLELARQSSRERLASDANPFGGPDAVVEGDRSIASEKPPLGCCPRRVRTLQRAGELAGAIARYLDAGRMPKCEWTLEFEQLLGWLQQHGAVDKSGEAV